MQVLEQCDLAGDLETPAAQKLVQALELMATGLRLQRIALGQQNPGLGEAALESAFQAWLFAEDDG